MNMWPYISPKKLSKGLHASWLLTLTYDLWPLEIWSIQFSSNVFYEGLIHLKWWSWFLPHFKKLSFLPKYKYKQ